MLARSGIIRIGAGSLGVGLLVGAAVGVLTPGTASTQSTPTTTSSTRTTTTSPAPNTTMLTIPGPVVLEFVADPSDAVFDRALQAGATSIRPVADQFYGDRSGQFEDPFGHRWNVATHIEDVTPEEIARRAASSMGGS